MAKLHTVYPATWQTKVAGKSDVTIDEITNIALSDGEDPQVFFGDGNTYAEFGWLENINQGVVIDTANLNLIAVATNLLDIGDYGTLTTYFPQRDRVGFEQSGTPVLKTIIGGAHDTNDGCMVEVVDPSASQSGAAMCRLGFTTSSVDGTTSAMAVSAIGYDYLP